MIQQRKGITPVIAIVLLLLVTVGAVGVVYTQFQSITEQGNTNFNTKARQVDLTITSVKNATNSNKVNGTMKLTITNNKNSVTFNTSRMLMALYYPNRAGPGSAVSWDALPVQNVKKGKASLRDTCFDDKGGAIIDPGESYTCNTNVEWPSATKYVGIVIQVQGGANSWTKKCDPLTTDSATC